MSKDTIDAGAIIYGLDSSNAQEYAKVYSRTFIIIDKISLETTTPSTTTMTATTTTTSSLATTKATTVATTTRKENTTSIITTTTSTETTPKLVLQENAVELQNGEQYQIIANQNGLTYSSNRPDVAVVSSNGKITALKEGTAIIL